MPAIEPPAQSRVNGTRKNAAPDRVVAPSSNSFPWPRYHLPPGGREVSTSAATRSWLNAAKLKVSSHWRHSARSVETFTSSNGISARHFGHVSFTGTKLAKSAGQVHALKAFLAMLSLGKQIGPGQFRVPQKAGPKRFAVPRAPKELPVTPLIRTAHGGAEWKLLLGE